VWGKLQPTGTWSFLVALAVLLLGTTVVVALRRAANRGLDKLVKGDLQPGGGKMLIALAPGDQRTLPWMRAVRDLIAQTRPDADILSLKFPSHSQSNADAFEISEQMCHCIADQFNAGTYDGVILVGYSRGALLLRKAYVYGRGLIQDLETVAAATREPMPWAEAVGRLVLLAGMNRGWTLRQRLPTMSIAWWLFLWLATRIGRMTGTALQMLQYESGHPFVANLRIQWLDLMRHLPVNQQPVVIQLLGDRDDLVSSEDQRDVTVARDFIWVRVSNSTHNSIIDVADPVSGRERQDKIRQAVGDDAAVTRLRRLSSKLPDNRDPDVEVVVVVLHGIRDMAAWTNAFERPLQEAFTRSNPGTAKLHVHRASYDFFGMLPFLLWADRQKNVRWFMDEFTEIKARFPNLQKVHFIGHSNGTYVLASALDKYKALKVDRVAFAGSVVRRDYNWNSLEGRIAKVSVKGRTGVVRNFIASGDCVVGLFPRLFELWPFSLINRDLGSAGFNGFDQALGNGLEVRYVRGSHSAALVPENIPAIVDFIIEGKLTDPPPEIYPAKRSGLMEYGSRLCWIAWVVAIVLAGAVVWGCEHAFHALVLWWMPALRAYATWFALPPAFFVLLLILRYL
jgi:predicted esterase